MKTAKKVHDGRGGWTTVVTTDDGTEIKVELVRGHKRRGIFGHDSYYWDVNVSGPGWEHRMAASPADSARLLALRGLRRQAEVLS